MSGLGVKLFLSGEVLSANELNGFLMSQAVCRFATVAARDNGFGDGVPVASGGSGKPLISEGRTAWIDDINTLQVYDGTSWLNITQVNATELTVSNKTANYVLVLADKNNMIEMDMSTSNTVTIPLNATVAFPVGAQVSVSQYGLGKTQIVGVAGVTVRATPGNFLRDRYSTAGLIKRATNEWYLIGDLSAT